MVLLKVKPCVLLALLLVLNNVVAGDQRPADEDHPECLFPGTTQHIPDTQPPPSQDVIIDIGNVDQLQPFCQKAYDPGVSAAPLVEDGVAYYPTWNGLLVALDYENCKTRWELNITELILEEKGNSDAAGAALAARTTPVSDGDILFIGTLARAILIAVDKSTGRVIDTLFMDRHPLAILTQSPTLYEGRLFIGVSTTESGAPSIVPSYRLSHHGSMNAVVLQHGRLALLWTTHMIPPGANFSGASVWGSQPSIDPIRQQVVIGTGQLFSLPPAFVECQDANKNLAVNLGHLANEPCLPRDVYQTSVLALDIATGHINWYRTLGPLDAWNSACIPSWITSSNITKIGPNCPKNVGNDTDFGMAPAFVLGSQTTPGGQDIVVVGQKNGNLYAFSAQTGTVLWGRAVAPGGTEGGLSWGVAVDDGAVYYTVINSNHVNFTLPNGDTISNSAFGAVRLQDGSTLWQTAAPRNTSTGVAPVIVNDVILTGLTGNWSRESHFAVGPGSFLALDKRTGEILLEISLDAYFRGNIATVHGYVMFGTGYGGSSTPANGTFNVWKLETAGASLGNHSWTPSRSEEVEAKAVASRN